MVFLATISFTPTQAQDFPEPKITIQCQGSGYRIEVNSWAPDDLLTVYIDDAEIASATTSADGAAVLNANGGGLHKIVVTNGEGNTIMAGLADCLAPPPEIEYLDVEPPTVTAFVNVPFAFSVNAVGADNQGNRIYELSSKIMFLWITEACFCMLYFTKASFCIPYAIPLGG